MFPETLRVSSGVVLLACGWRGTTEYRGLCFFSVKPYRKAVQPSTAEVRRGCTVSALGPLLATVYNTVYRIRLATRFGSYLSHEKETKTGDRILEMSALMR